MARNIETRTSEAQNQMIAWLIDRGAVIHTFRHNLDGLWLNIEYTDDEGDWVASIDRDGNIERTQ